MAGLGSPGPGPKVHLHSGCQLHEPQGWECSAGPRSSGLGLSACLCGRCEFHEPQGKGVSKGLALLAQVPMPACTVGASSMSPDVGGVQRGLGCLAQVLGPAYMVGAASMNPRDVGSTEAWISWPRSLGLPTCSVLDQVGLGSHGLETWECLHDGCWVQEAQESGVQCYSGHLAQVLKPTCRGGIMSVSPRVGIRLGQGCWPMSVSQPTRSSLPQCKGWSAGRQTMVYIKPTGACRRHLVP